MRVLAIDPGETCGIAVVGVGLGASDDAVWPIEVTMGKASAVFARLTDRIQPDIVICEEFRLYPSLATQQGFSTFPTVEVIGVVKYLCAVRGLPLFMQKPTVLKEARHLAEQHGWPMKERSLGSGKGKYRGPDFNYPGKQHPRDALGHAVHWAYTNRQSPAYEG